MAKITIDGQKIECRKDLNVLQAALEAGINVPHYCYHPGLSVVASCRLCLMQMKMPNPKTGEMDWSPRLVPACQTPVRSRMEVRFKSPAVEAARARTLELYLLNHPLDCPVCDQAGECLLQDYSETFGSPTSRMVEQKHSAPKKDIGPHTLLYSNRCVFCKRCIRFTHEISGTNELCAVNRGSCSEVDVFQGMPLDNPLQGNVVDICPVGSLLDKGFLFKQRVWFLDNTPSICPGCSTGCAVHVDHNENHVYRLKPRFNPGVNDWWMCDEGRFGYKYIHDEKRITKPLLRRGAGRPEMPLWEDIPGIVRFRLEQIAREQGGDKIAVMLSPFMSCEEAWLLSGFVRSLAPEAALVVGPIPTEGDERKFPVGAQDGDVKFVIRNEKCPNRRGVELIVKSAGGNVSALDEFIEKCTSGAFSAAWIVGGNPLAWVSKELGAIAKKVSFLVVQDMFENALTKAATLVLPACAFAERDGSFMNHADKIQPFARAIDPPEGVKRDGQYLYEIAGHVGLFDAERVREMMAEGIEAFGTIHEALPAPKHLH
ncbi:MAG: (2Fe-2S)-binding protein [Phycisphaerae bacterium]|nr:(2Fe-2S)-binding protein [Phycisphaerae bacterium]